MLEGCSGKQLVKTHWELPFSWPLGAKRGLGSPWDGMETPGEDIGAVGFHLPGHGARAEIRATCLGVCSTHVA